MSVLVTGASGFIGLQLCAKLTTAGRATVACSRSRMETPGIFYVYSPELGPAADWVNNTLAEGDLLAGMRKLHEKSL